MGLEYVIEDENRTTLREVGDPRGILTGLLDRAHDEGLPLLSGIDRYGDTVFNRQQIPRVSDEWRSLLRWASTEEQRALIGEIVVLCEECQSSIHIYLRIVGD